MKTISRYILTLVALFAISTGAWATDDVLLVTITAADNSSFNSGSQTFDNIATVTLSGEVYCFGDENGWFSTSEGTLTVTAAEGYTITRVKFYTKSNSAFDEEAPFEAILVSGMDGITSIEVYGYAGTPEPGIEVTTNAAEEGATFTEASFEMPTFDATADYELVRDMSYKVAFSGVPTRARLAKDGNGKFHFADGLTFQLLDNIDAANPKDITSAEGITFMVGEVVPFDFEGSTFYQLNKETLVPLADFLADAHLGNYAICAVASTGEYDGSFSSGMITLFQGYDLTLNSPQVSSVAVTIGDAAVTPQEGGRIPGIEKDKSVKLSVSEGYMFSDMFTGYKVSFTPAGDALAWNKVGCYYWGNYGDNNIFNPVQWPGVQMTKNGTNWETIVNANGLTNIIFNDYQTNNQQTSDLPFASGAADDLGSYTIADAVEMTYNTAMTEATFSMPASDVALNFSVKRNLGVKTAAEMAERIRINKTGDTYSPIQMTDVQPTVTNNLDAQNPVVLEYGKDYNTTLQKKGEGQDEWIDTQDYGVGTFRLMVTGEGEYGGTCYTNEFELYAGYEVTVAAGEYISYYSNEPLMIEDTDAQLYTVSSVTDNEAVLSDAFDAAPARTPLLVYNKSQETKTFLLIPCNEPDLLLSVAPEFKGTLEATTIAASSETADNYALNGYAFVWVKYAIEIGANKCWLQIGNQPAKARANTRSIVNGGNTTGINAIEDRTIDNEGWYELNGRKLQAKPTKKGIYIHNGKKVVVK